MIPVWIVDEHAIVRQGVKQILQQESNDIRVTAEASSIAELLNLFESQLPHPRAIILDLSINVQSGFESLTELKRLYPELPILILSIYPEEPYALRGLKAGASGYLSKTCTPEQLVQAISTISNGEKFITSRVSHLHAESISSPSASLAPHEKLSDREFQILILISQGKSLTEIGERFQLSVKTVSTYRTRVLKKMNMKTNAELIQYVITRQMLLAS